LFLRRDADAGVGYGEMQGFRAIAGSDAQVYLTFERELDGVAHQVGEDLAQADLIADPGFGDAGCDGPSDGDPLLQAARDEQPGDALDRAA
jgi:hypothetical protein